jgi:hypothetical protein
MVGLVGHQVEQAGLMGGKVAPVLIATPWQPASTDADPR